MRDPVKITKHGRERWMVDLREFGAGRRFFTTQSAARTFQSQMLADRATHGDLAWDLPHDARMRFLAAERRLASAGGTLEQAVDYWCQSHRPSQQKTLGEAVEACLAAKAESGGRPRAVDQLRYALHSFARSIGPGLFCDAVTLEKVETWLANLAWAQRTRKGRLIDLRTFFAFAIRRGWARTDPSAGVEPFKLDSKPPGILTVPEVRKLLEATRKTAPRFLPFMVLGIFCGVRPEEIKQLTWKQINLETNYVEIPAAVAKRVRNGGSRQRRLIKLQPNAIAWLKLGGDLPPISWQDQFDRIRRAAGFEANARGRHRRRRRTKGVPWSRNAMRHSFCSYALPIFGELKESEWAGHSPQVAVSTYRELVTEEAAREFWTVSP